jgi:hypothetical protein
LRRFVFLIALAAASCGDACDNECSFGERCHGDTLEICGDGPDQFFHRRVHAVPCEAPAAACADGASTGPTCVVAPPTPCDTTFADRCDGDVRVYCPALHAIVPAGAPPDYVSAMDCAAWGATCVVDAREGVVCRAIVR